MSPDDDRQRIDEVLQLACDLCIGLGGFVVAMTGRLEGLVSDPELADEGPGRIEQLARSCLSHPAAAGHALFWNAELDTEGESAEHLLACVAAPVWAGGVQRGILGVVDTWLPEPGEHERVGLGTLACDLGALLAPRQAEPADVGGVQRDDHRAVGDDDRAVGDDDRAVGDVRRLRTSEPQLAAVLDAVPVPLAVAAADGVVVFANHAYASLVGQDVDGLVGEPLSHAMSLRTEDGMEVARCDHPGLEAARAGAACAASLLLGDGADAIRVEVSAWPWHVEGRTGAVVELRSLTVDPLAHQRSLPEAAQDPLTGLPARSLLLEELERMLRSLGRRSGSLCLVCLDVDDAGRLRGRHGPGVADELLVAIARRLTAAVRGEDVVARPGAHQFVVVHAVPAAAPDGDLAVGRVRKVLAAPFRIRDLTLTVDPLVAWVSTTAAYERPDALLARALAAVGSGGK